MKLKQCMKMDGSIGAKKLAIGKLADREIIAMIETWKKIMPSLKNKFSPSEINILNFFGY
jgi:hypothetical protein